MKSNYFHRFSVIGILLFSSFLYAQKPITEEEKKLEFQTYFFEALKQKAINNYSKAIESLEKCYELDSTNLAVNFEFSKNHLLLNNFFEAEIFIDKALKKEPKNNYLLMHKVAIYKSQRNFEKAIEIQKKVIQIQPTEADELVLLYIQNQNFDKAEKLIAEIEQNALSTSKTKGLKKYLENRKVAIEVSNNQIIPVIKNLDIEVLKKLYDEQKDYNTVHEILNKEEADALFELLYIDSKKALELFPAQPFLYIMNGLALNKLGKYNEAINVLTIGIDFVIDTEMEADFYGQLSISYEKLDKKNEALKYKQKALELRKLIK